MQKKSSSLIVGLIVAAMSVLSLPAQAAGKYPSFKLAASEYPSWATFFVADMRNLINGKAGEYGPIEEKWSVDIVLEEAEYDPCLVMYGSGTVDAICVTSLDVLPSAMTRPSVNILPTSTSVGGDACIVDKSIGSIADLKGKEVYGLDKSCSRYVFERNLGLAGFNSEDFKFVNMDPGAAAVAMQQKQSGYSAIMVWNPFILSTLASRSDARVLFSSNTIPGEVLDSVVMAQASLDKPGGDRFACAVIEAYYAVTKLMDDPATADATMIDLGKKFSNLGLKDMRQACKDTRFYNTSDKALTLFGSDELKDTTRLVVDFCQTYGIVDHAPVIGYGTKEQAPKGDLRFDASYIKQYLAGPKAK